MPTPRDFVKILTEEPPVGEAKNLRQTRRYATKRNFRRKLKRTVLFFVIIVAATFLLNLLFNFSSGYMPTLNEPKDADREKLQKVNDVNGNQGKAPQP